MKIFDSSFFLPDRTVPAVRVSSQHGAHLRAARCVLINIQNIMVDRKNGSFVHVPDRDFKGGGVFERAQVGKTRIHVCVDSLDVKGVGLLPLVVQRLEEKSQQWNEINAQMMQRLYSVLLLFHSHTGLKTLGKLYVAPFWQEWCWFGRVVDFFHAGHEHEVCWAWFQFVRY